MSSFTAADAEAAIRRLSVEHQRISNSLLELEDHVGRTLTGAVLHGETRERWQGTEHGYARLWVLYQAYRSGAEQIEAIRARRARPTNTDLSELEGLLTGDAAVAVPSNDYAAQQPDRRAGLRWVAGQIEATLADVSDVLATVDQIWAELTPLIDRCDQLLTDAATLAADLGLTSGGGSIVGKLAQQTATLDALRRVVVSDPLRLSSKDAVDRMELDELVTRCEQTYAEVRTLVELRAESVILISGVTDTLADAERAFRQAAEEQELASSKISGLAESTPPSPDAALTTRLAAVKALREQGDWERLASELPRLVRDSRAEVSRGRVTLDSARAPLQLRAELRGRLHAYQAKAAGLGRLEDGALEHHYRQAHDLLWTAPCDLGVAAAAVDEYQDAVNSPATNDHRPELDTGSENEDQR